MASPEDHLLARSLADAAGELLVSLRQRLDGDGAPPSTLRDEGDRGADEYLRERLRRERPDDAILSEEGRGDEGPRGRERLDADRVWIIDPLDGTREYGEWPRTDWAVHVALVEDGVPTAAAISLPGRGLTLSTHEPPPAPPPPPTRPRIVVSRTRPPEVARHLARVLGAELVPMGSAGAKAAAVITGEADLYPHSGGQYEWDSCAPVGVAAAAGCFARRLDLSELRYNRPDPWLPDLVIANPALVEPVREALGAWVDPGW